MKSVILILILFLLKYLLLEGRNCFLFKKLRRKKILQYIDVNDEIVQFVKAAIMVISVHLKISTFFVASHVLSAKVSPEWRLNPGFRPRKPVPFP